MPLNDARPTPKPARPGSSYQKIEEVPYLEIKRLLMTALERFGATEEGDLKQTITRQLGFQRMGRIIRTRIESCIGDLIREGKICRAEGDVLKVNATPDLKHG